MFTSLADRDNRIRGIESGANDFLNKLIDQEDVMLRVRNAVNTKKLYDQVQDHLRQLEELEEMRDKLVHVVVHDL